MNSWKYILFSIGLTLVLPFEEITAQEGQPSSLEILVLGIAQDGGYPQMACKKACCAELEKQTHVTSLAVIDRKDLKVWLVDCTPDIRAQWKMIERHLGTADFSLEGIFLTHAHIGHYAGLSQLGREVMGSREIKVYAMPRMRIFLEDNGPWSQLVSLKNIVIHPIADRSDIVIDESLTFKPISVPHRDEFSETVGYEIYGPNKNVLFIPDIDQWSLWEDDLLNEIKAHDYALLDATFYSANELPGRNLEDIPHPTMSESMELMKDLSDTDKQKVHFIHLNHTNPVLRETPERKSVMDKGFSLADQGLVLEL